MLESAKIFLGMILAYNEGISLYPMIRYKAKPAIPFDRKDWK